MIRTVRRGFWLTVGAAAGIGGYRKVTRLARAVSPPRPPAGAGPVTARSASAATAAAWLVRGVRASALFARDVREGMRIYRLADRRAAYGPHGAAKDGAGNDGAATDGAATARRAKDWAFAEREMPRRVKDGR